MIELYTTGCPKCHVLEKKLVDKNIEFKIIEGDEGIRNLGYSSAPLLKVDDEVKEFPEAVAWVNRQ